ncbi:hypothetical protein V1477_012241 [Vespula maculifrons]
MEEKGEAEVEEERRGRLSSSSRTLSHGEFHQGEFSESLGTTPEMEAQTHSDPCENSTLSCSPTVTAYSTTATVHIGFMEFVDDPHWYIKFSAPMTNSCNS